MGAVSRMARSLMISLLLLCLLASQVEAGFSKSKQVDPLSVTLLVLGGLAATCFCGCICNCCCKALGVEVPAINRSEMNRRRHARRDVETGQPLNSQGGS